ncbi:hypothetical protein Tco_1010574 [Tanacetum coccineum]
MQPSLTTGWKCWFCIAGGSSVRTLGWRGCDAKTSEFLKETQEKDAERLRQQKAMARETEARAREKCIIIG